MQKGPSEGLRESCCVWLLCAYCGIFQTGDFAFSPLSHVLCLVIRLLAIVKRSWGSDGQRGIFTSTNRPFSARNGHIASLWPPMKWLACQSCATSCPRFHACQTEATSDMITEARNKPSPTSKLHLLRQAANLTRGVFWNTVWRWPLIITTPDWPGISISYYSGFILVTGLSILPYFLIPFVRGLWSCY